MPLWMLLACKKDPPEPTVTDGDADTDTDTDADTDVDTDVEPPPTTYVRFVHVATSIGPVDLWVDGAAGPVARGFAPPDGTPFDDQAPGDRTVAVTAPGGSVKEPIAQLSESLARNARTTFVLFGDPSAVGFEAFPETVSDFPADEVRFTFFNTLARTVDVLVEGATVSADYGQRTILGEWTPEARDVSVDVDRDGAPECTVVLQGLPAGTIASLYLVDAGLGPTVYGHDGDGRWAALPDGACLGAGGSGTGSTGGTGSGGSAADHSGSH